MKKLKKDEGSLFNYVVPIGSMILIFVLSLYLITNRKVYNERDYVENGLAAATLSGAVADLNLYGSTNVINIKEPQIVYQNFLKSLKENLELDNNFKPINKSIITSPVKVVSYIIYNVTNNDIEEIQINDGMTNKIDHPGALGILKSPRGDLIKNSSIYSKIRFTIGGFMGINYDKAEKECFVDITDKEE